MKQDLPAELHTPDGIMAYCARVSSPHQDNPNYENLLKYCSDHGHWSVFEMADMCVEITTSRALSQQILRHRSFSFQEFSQRYATASMGFECYEARRQDVKNRQNSLDDMSDETKSWFKNAQQEIQDHALSLYEQALEKNIAKEQSRFLLPLSTTTKLYMKGSVRSWITYLMVRLEEGTQKEHRDVALAIKEHFKPLFPITAKSLNW
jgi:thymidylate synthase (FAD)